MKNKREIDSIILTFAITTIFWTLTWVLILESVSKDYEQKIKYLENHNADMQIKSLTK